MSHGRTIIRQDGADRTLHFQRMTLPGSVYDAGSAYAGQYRWVRLDLPPNGRRLYIRNEDGAQVLDVSFMRDPSENPVISFFTLSSTAGLDSERTMDFIPRSCWIRQHAANQQFYWEVIDDQVDQDQEEGESESP